MILFVSLLGVLTLTQARMPLRPCRGVVINNVMYEKEILVDNLNSPYQLALDRYNNILYFSESIPNRSVDGEVFMASYLNLNTMKYGNIPEVRGGFANAVDYDKKIVYIGGRNGIYSYDSTAKTVTHITAEGQNIWQIFYKNKLYYTTYPEEKAYVYDGVSYLIPVINMTNVMLLAVDNKMNLYFSNSTGLFCLTNKNKDILPIGIYPYNVNSFTSDANGELYFSTPGGIYHINDKVNTIDLLVTFDNLFGFVIETDGNIIYAEESSITRLKSTKLSCDPETDGINY